MGVDLGFSKTRDTTGIACLDGDQLHLCRAGTQWENRKERIPLGFQPSVIALDGPVLPRGADERIRRQCEFVFSYAPFWNRCKPGLSHWGFGLEMRRAATEACSQFSKILPDSAKAMRRTFPVCCHAIVEAFPNAFLAVLLPEGELHGAPKLRRGCRFDWLYERAFRANRLTTVLSVELDLPAQVWDRLISEDDHELRAALVCLLTAAFVAHGSASKIGDAETGWFWLPPFSLWQDWAKEGLDRATAKWRLK